MSARQRPAPPSGPRSAGVATACLVALTLILATALVVAGVPVALRLACVAVLVGIPGVALVRLMLGRSRRPQRDGEPFDRGSDPAVRATLAVLLGILLSLFVTLALNTARVRISGASVAISVGAAGLVLLIAARCQRLGRKAPGQKHSAALPLIRPATLRTVAALTCCAAALAAAFAVANALQPPEQNRYTSLNFLDSKPFSADRDVVAPADPVRIDWVIRGVGYEFSPRLTSVEVRVDGSPVEDVAVDLGTVTPPDISGATGAMVGAVTFPAPRAAGRHSVLLTVHPVSGDGVPLPDPGFLTTSVEVAE